MEIINKVEENYLFGCIKYNQVFNFYLMPLAYWILNYKKYDPNYNPEKWSFVFRDNILNVLDKDVALYLRAIKIDKLNIFEFENSMKNIPSNYRVLYFFIDFDKKKFINGFYDLDVENYLPDHTWSDEFGNPTDYIPNEFKLYFMQQ